MKTFYDLTLGDIILCKDKDRKYFLYKISSIRRYPAGDNIFDLISIDGSNKLSLNINSCYLHSFSYPKDNVIFNSDPEFCLKENYSLLDTIMTNYSDWVESIFSILSDIRELEKLLHDEEVIG